MDKKTAYLFPGQGAQYPGMAMDLSESAAVKLVFDTASDILQMDIKELLLSDHETLKRTDISQPAITAANLAAAAYMDERGYKAAACAGFSLGEYAALVCAGIIDTADCFRLVTARGKAMQSAIDRLTAHGENAETPGMAAVIGLSPVQAEELIKQWNKTGLKDIYAANINSPRQLTVSGTAAALAEAEKLFKEAGAKRVLRLQVAGPFHSPLMAEAVEAFEPVLETVTFRDPVIPVFSNVTGQIITSGAEAKKLAAMQIISPVRWVDVQTALAACGIEECFETGPGSVLQGLWKTMENNIPVFAAEKGDLSPTTPYPGS